MGMFSEFSFIFIDCFIRVFYCVPFFCSATVISASTSPVFNIIMFKNVLVLNCVGRHMGCV